MTRVCTFIGTVVFSKRGAKVYVTKTAGKRALTTVSLKTLGGGEGDWEREVGLECAIAALTVAHVGGADWPVAGGRAQLFGHFFNTLQLS